MGGRERERERAIITYSFIHNPNTVATRPVLSTVSYALLILSVNAKTVVPAAAVPVVAKSKNRVRPSALLTRDDDAPGDADDANVRFGRVNDGR